jgi:TonB-linked SusC/RagA family outer membrane protein
MLMGCFCFGLSAQKKITGTVRDAMDGSTLPGVSVQVKGSNRGTVTDIDGNYSLSLEAADRDLVFSYIGMKSQTVSIGNQVQINVVLSSDANLLGEVVVSALGIKREARSLTVAQQRVDAETLAEVRDQNIVSSLAGKIAGVMVTPPTSATGSARIVIRGNSSFTGNNQPLFVIDGMQIDNSDGSNGVNKNGGLDLGNGASDINPDDIETIDVLKGPNAAALYGSRAANGVIIITTKKAKEGRFRVSASSNTMFRYISQWPDFQNAFGVGHMTQMVGGDLNRLVTEDTNGNLLPYPGLPSMELMMQANQRSLGGPLLGQPYIGLDGQMYTYSPEPDNIYGYYQTAYTNTNNLAVEGGSAENNYRVSYTNLNANDVIDKQNLVTRNTLTLRFFNTLVKNLTLDSKVTVIDDNTENRRYANQSDYNPLYMYTNLPRNITLAQIRNYKNDQGEEIAKMPNTHNPYWIINETSNEDSKRRILANFDLSYQILPSLRATVKYAREYISTKRYEFRNSGALGSVDDMNGFYKEEANLTDNNMSEFLFVYNTRFSDFSLVSTFGGSRNNYWNYWNSAEIRKFKQAGFKHISNTDEAPRTDEAGYANSPRKRINALYASASLGFKEYAYLDLTGRNDWSSALPPGNNSYFYPSVGISLIPSEILGIPSRLFYGKLRASWAQVGNDTGEYRLVPYYSLNASNVFNGYKYASIDDTLPEKYLKPEMTTSYEIGADLRFLNGRINADITYYQSNSRDQIVRSQMAASSGSAWKMYNAGEIQNDGWEVALRMVPIENRTFSWDADINFTKNNSIVKSMVEGLDRIELGEVFSLKNVVATGLPYGAMFGTQWLRDKDGRRMVNLSNGEPVRKENAYLGNFNPDFLLGFSNRFRIKDFDIYVLLDMKKGGKLYSGTRRQSIRNGVIAGFDREQESYWKRMVVMGDPGDNNLWGGVLFGDGLGSTHFTNENIYYYEPARYDDDMNTYEVVYNAASKQYEKKLDANGNWIPDPNYVPEQCTQYFWPGNVGYYADGQDDLVIYDASYVKLREIAIGYNLPKKLISKIKMTNARISIVGRNLWTFYQKTPKGLDPEAALNAGNGQGLESGSLPPSTTFGFDIKIAF